MDSTSVNNLQNGSAEVPISPTDIEMVVTGLESNAIKQTEETKKEQYIPSPIPQTKESFLGASLGSTVLSLVNAIIGAGILSMAYSIRQGGYIGSIFMIILVLVPSLITLNYVSIICLYTSYDVYGKIGAYLFNKPVGILADLSLCLLTFGVNVAYMNVLFAQISDIAIGYFNASPDFFASYGKYINLIVSLAILFPLSSMKNMDSLKYTNFLVIVCVAIFVIACIYLGFKTLFSGELKYNPWPDSTDHLATAFSVFVLSFCCHANAPKLFSELKFNTHSKFSSRITKMNRAALYAYLICAFSYLFVGVCGYFAFGENINGSILNSLNETSYWFTPVIKVGYGLVVLFSYPIVAYAPTYTIDSILFKSERKTLRRLIEVFIYIILSYLVCSLFPTLESIFGITGSTCGTLILLIWPSIFYLKVCHIESKKPLEQRKKWLHISKKSYTTAWIILVVGIVVCIWATYMELSNFIKRH